MGPQVRDSRRIYLTALRRPPPKTTVSHPKVVSHPFQRCQRPSHRDLADGSTPILPHPWPPLLGDTRAIFGLTQNRFLGSLFVQVNRARSHDSTFWCSYHGCLCSVCCPLYARYYRLVGGARTGTMLSIDFKCTALTFTLKCKISTWELM